MMLLILSGSITDSFIATQFQDAALRIETNYSIRFVLIIDVKGALSWKLFKQLRY